MGYHAWTDEETDLVVALFDDSRQQQGFDMDLICREALSLLAALAGTEASNMKESQIQGKYTSISRSISLTPKELWNKGFGRIFGYKDRRRMKATLAHARGMLESNHAMRNATRSPSVEIVSTTNAEGSLTATCKAAPHAKDRPTLKRKRIEEFAAVEQLPGTSEENVSQGLDLEPWESQLVLSLRSTLNQQGAKYIPPKAYVIDTFDRIDEYVHKAVDNFIKAKSCRGLTTTNLSSAGRKLCMTFLPAPTEEQVDQWFESYLGSNAFSVELALLTMAAAAIFKFVVLDDDEVFKRKQYDPVDSEAWSFFHWHNKSMYEKLREIAHLTYLDKIVKPKIPSLACQFTRRLSDIFAELQRPGSRQPLESTHTLNTKVTQTIKLGPSIRMNHYRSWEEAMRAAFEKALDLQLKLRCSPCIYDIQYPLFDDLFNSETMEIVGDGKPDAGEARVWACLRPMIQSRDHLDQDSVMRILIKAQTVLD